MVKITGFCIENDEFCGQNDGCCIQNDGFCIENDEFCVENRLMARLVWVILLLLSARSW